MKSHITLVRTDVIKSLQIINTGEGVEKKLSYTTGGNVIWYSYYA